MDLKGDHMSSRYRKDWEWKRASGGASRPRPQTYTTHKGPNGTYFVGEPFKPSPLSGGSVPAIRPQGSNLPAGNRWTITPAGRPLWAQRDAARLDWRGPSPAMALARPLLRRFGIGGQVAGALLDGWMQRQNLDPFGGQGAPWYNWTPPEGEGEPWGGGEDPGRTNTGTGGFTLARPALPPAMTYNSVTTNPARLNALPLGKWTGNWWIAPNSPKSPAGSWGNLSANLPPGSLTDPAWSDGGSYWRLRWYYNGIVHNHVDPSLPIPAWIPDNYHWWLWTEIRAPKSTYPSAPSAIPEPGRIVEHPGSAWDPSMWPNDPPPVRAIPMPTPRFPPGIPWAMIPRYNGWRDGTWERSSTYDKPMPSVVPRPDGETIIDTDSPNTPPPVTPYAPPVAGTRERKLSSRHGWLLDLFRRTQSLFHELTEVGDGIDAVYEALPQWLRDKLERGGYMSPADKLKAIYDNFHLIDMDKAIVGLVWNHVEDYVIGKGFKGVSDAAKRLGINGGYKLEQPVLEAVQWLNSNWSK